MADADPDYRLGPPLLVHSAIRAHAERVRVFAGQYGALERAVLTDGRESTQARAAHEDLARSIYTWTAADRRAERADLVSLAADEQSRLREGLTPLVPYAELMDAEHEAEAEPSRLRESLVRAIAELPNALPRVTLNALRRIVARIRSVQRLNGPSFIFCIDAELAVRNLDWEREIESPRPIEFNPAEGFTSVFARALGNCVVARPPEPGRAGSQNSLDIGLGEAAIRSTSLSVRPESLAPLYEDWLREADLAHPLAHPPFVPHRWFAAVRPERAVCSGFESTGPLGWAADDELIQLAGEFRALAKSEVAIAAELGALAERLDEAQRQGYAVLAWLEYLRPEAEGRRLWLTQADDEDVDGGDADDGARDTTDQ